MNTQLTRPQNDRMIAGVCGGLARYFNVDPAIVRLVFVLAVFLGGVSPLVYLVLWIVMPEEPATAQSYAPPAQQLNAPQPGQPAQDPTGEWRYDPYTGEPIVK